jgi:hypothetical protein
MTKAPAKLMMGRSPAVPAPVPVGGVVGHDTVLAAAMASS